MKQALIGGGNSQRSTYQAHCGDKGWNRAQRVEVSTLTRKADEARRRRGQTRADARKAQLLR
jgi:hypothetical protein